MALRIETKNGRLDLESGYSIEIEDTNPMYNDRGSQTTAAKIPNSPKNMEKLGYWFRVDNTKRPDDERVTVIDGTYARHGKLNITAASYRDGITANIGFDESELYNIWSQVSLRSLALPKLQFDTLDLMISYLNDILRGTIKNELAIFPAFLSINKDDKGEIYKEAINRYTLVNGVSTLISDERVEIYYISNNAVPTTVPKGYGLAPFLRVSYLLEKVFSEYGYDLVENPFATDKQLSKLVMLHNGADVCVRGTINYPDLLPEVTINEFLHSLYARFGIVYYIDGSNKKARLKFIKDMINAPAQKDLTPYLSANPILNFEKSKQLKLSAATNITSCMDDVKAKPVSESFDNFLKPYDYRMHKTQVTTDSVYHMRAYGLMSRRNQDETSKEILSTDFFPWDKCSAQSYVELTAPDECVPVTMYYEEGFYFLIAPCYLFGKLHRYTLIETTNVEVSQEVTVKTPLAYSFSWFTQWGEPFGSPRCFDSIDNQIEDGDFSMINISDFGLFKKYWIDYDAILRWSNHVVDAQFNLDIKTLANLDMSKPILISGQRLMIDSLRYTLPAGSMLRVTAKLRTLKLLDPYNLNDQEVPIVWV